MRSLIPSLDAVALEVLAGTESSLSLARITQLASRGSRQGIATVLARLVEHRLVTAHPANEGALYHFNPGPHSRPIRGHRRQRTCRSPAKVADRRRRTRSRADHGSALWFERAWRGCPDSDIDLFVVVQDEIDPADIGWTDQIDALVQDVRAWTVTGWNRGCYPWPPSPSPSPHANRWLIRFATMRHRCAVVMRCGRS